MTSLKTVVLPMHHYRDNGEMADGGRKVTVYLPELPPDEVAALSGGSGQAGYVAFKANQITEADLPIGDAPIDSDERTPGQRLRGKLYRLWESQGSKSDFELYYRVAMERFIKRVEAQING